MISLFGVMTNTDTRDLNAAVNQIARLKDAGCNSQNIGFDNDCVSNIPLIKSR